MLSGLESGSLDMTILYESEFQGQSGLKCIPLHDRRLRVCLFIAKDHPLAKKPDLNLTDIRDEPIGILDRKYSFDFQKRMELFFPTTALRRRARTGRICRGGIWRWDFSPNAALLLCMRRCFPMRDITCWRGKSRFRTTCRPEFRSIGKRKRWISRQRRLPPFCARGCRRRCSAVCPYI